MPPQASETTSERPQWERIAGQSRNAYEAFRRYRDAGSHRSIAGARSIERRWSSKWQWADRAGEWDSELYRRQDEATRLAAGGARPILEVVGPLAELNDDPWVDVVRRLEDHARRLGSTCRAFPSGSAITIQLASPWPMSIRVGPEEVETVDLRLLITVERWSEVEMQPVLPGLRHQWRTTPT